jgi:hypothetical protein
MVVYLLLTTLGRNKKFPKLHTLTTNRLFQCIVIGVIAMGAINSIGVLSTSQLLLATNFKLVDAQSGKPLPPAKMEDVSLTTTFFHNSMNINFDAHIVPGILGMFLLMLLGVCRTTKTHYNGKTTMGRSWKANLGLFGYILLLQAILIGVWMCVPITDDEGVKYTWIKKLKYVYANPKGYLFGIQAGIVVALALILAFNIS